MSVVFGLVCLAGFTACLVGSVYAYRRPEISGLEKRVVYPDDWNES